MAFSESLKLGGLSDYQAVVRYNPNVDSDDESVEEIICEYNYIVSYPGKVREEIMSDADCREIYRTPKDAERDFLQYTTSQAFEFRKTSAIVLVSMMSIWPMNMTVNLFKVRMVVNVRLRNCFRMCV